MPASSDPDHYKRTREGFTYNDAIEDITSTWSHLLSPEELPFFEQAILDLHEFTKNFKLKDFSPTDLHVLAAKQMQRLRRANKRVYKKASLLLCYSRMVASKRIPKNVILRKMLTKKASKSLSGVLVVTVLTSPFPHGQKFSCEWNCYYCPDEPKQPRSYLHDEPSVLRANRNRFDPVLQFFDRCTTLAMNGHPIDKIELIVLGGTWASYPEKYREEFMRDLFFAANVFDFESVVATSKALSVDGKTSKTYPKLREKFSLQREKRLNETCTVKIIGITLETRPDCISVEEVRLFRFYGCTRVQLGLQTTHDDILKKINRKSTISDAKAAIRRLKNACFKIDVHLMPNLPGSSKERDLEMFHTMLNDPDLQVDQWKIYPTEITPWTVIAKWHEKGSYDPYPDSELIQVLMEIKPKVHPWIRLNRVVRDIPSQYVLGGLDNPSLRQSLSKKLKERNTPCRCVRCREVGSKDNSQSAGHKFEPKIKSRKYDSSGGTEFFISLESPDESMLLYGFCRLRIVDSTSEVFQALDPESTALIRELHVYGQLVATSDKLTKSAPQHVGVGTLLMNEAERMAVSHGKSRAAVIAGVGARGFYERLGYETNYDYLDYGEMMYKSLSSKRGGDSSRLLPACVVAIASLLMAHSAISSDF